MPTFKITLAYDGTDFVGWQRQANGPSIQGLLEEALRELDGRVVIVNGAGRTDAGVHALGQVASCSLERAVSPDVLVRALNARLPSGVRALSAVEARPDFHARFDARAKIYRYRIWNAAVLDPFERRYAWHLPGPLDVDAMEAAASFLEGRHDFAGFQASGGGTHTTERTIRTSVVSRTGALVVYEVAGDGFLRHMVRTIVGTLVDVGRGRWPAEHVRGVLTAADRTLAGPTAPAEGLFLVSVEYGDL
jgi:tRNA pseudouridine38-40 synthase